MAVGTGFAQRWQDFDPRQCQAEDALQVEIIEKLIITADVPTDCSGRTAPTPVLRADHRPMGARPTRLGAVPHLPGPDPERQPVITGCSGRRTLGTCAHRWQQHRVEVRVPELLRLISGRDDSPPPSHLRRMAGFDASYSRINITCASRSISMRGSPPTPSEACSQAECHDASRVLMA